MRFAVMLAFPQLQTLVQVNPDLITLRDGCKRQRVQKVGVFYAGLLWWLVDHQLAHELLTKPLRGRRILV